jgi:hypothetical protein
MGVLLRLLVHVATGAVDLPSFNHAPLTTWASGPLGKRTTQLACSCGVVFWMRPGYEAPEEGAVTFSIPANLPEGSLVCRCPSGKHVGRLVFKGSPWSIATAEDRAAFEWARLPVVPACGECAPTAAPSADDYSPSEGSGSISSSAS